MQFFKLNLNTMAGVIDLFFEASNLTCQHHHCSRGQYSKFRQTVYKTNKKNITQTFITTARFCHVIKEWNDYRGDFNRC